MKRLGAGLKSPVTTIGGSIAAVVAAGAAVALGFGWINEEQAALVVAFGASLGSFVSGIFGRDGSVSSQDSGVRP